MSLQLRISRSREHRPQLKESTRQLLRLNEVPHTSSTPSCEAIGLDGRPCRVTLSSDTSDLLCIQHHMELGELDMRWSKTQKEAEKVQVLSLDDAKQKVLKLRQSVALRRQIRHRFYHHGGDIQDYIKWIAKLESDITQLADSLLSRLRLHMRHAYDLPVTQCKH